MTQTGLIVVFSVVLQDLFQETGKTTVNELQNNGCAEPNTVTQNNKQPVRKLWRELEENFQIDRIEQMYTNGKTVVTPVFVAQMCPQA